MGDWLQQQLNPEPDPLAKAVLFLALSSLGQWCVLGFMLLHAYGRI